MWRVMNRKSNTLSRLRTSLSPLGVPVQWMHPLTIFIMMTSSSSWSWSPSPLWLPGSIKPCLWRLDSSLEGLFLLFVIYSLHKLPNVPESPWGPAPVLQDWYMCVCDLCVCMSAPSAAVFFKDSHLPCQTFLNTQITWENRVRVVGRGEVGITGYQPNIYAC